MLDLKNGKSCTKNVALPNETNLNIHFYLNLFLLAIKKTPYWQFGGTFFCDFAPFLFSIENKSAFLADPNVPIPGSYTAVVRKLPEKIFSRKIFIFGQNTGARKLYFYIFFLNCGYFVRLNGPKMATKNV